MVSASTWPPDTPGDPAAIGLIAHCGIGMGIIGIGIGIIGIGIGIFDIGIGIIGCTARDRKGTRHTDADPNPLKRSNLQRKTMYDIGVGRARAFTFPFVHLKTRSDIEP